VESVTERHVGEAGLIQIMTKQKRDLV